MRSLLLLAAVWMGGLCSVHGQKLFKHPDSGKVKIESGILLFFEAVLRNLWLLSVCLSVGLSAFFSVTIFFLLFFLSVSIFLPVPTYLSFSLCMSVICLSFCLYLYVSHTHFILCHSFELHLLLALDSVII